MGVKPPALFFTDYVLPKTEWIKNGLTQTLKRDKKSVLDKKMFSKESQGIGSYKKHLRRALLKVSLDEAVYGVHRHFGAVCVKSNRGRGKKMWSMFET